MSAPINVSLRGYLDFFGLKNGGMNPQQPAGFVQPTMELQRWYLESRAIETQWSLNLVADYSGFLQISTQAPIILPPGTNLRVDVPQNETWVLLPGTSTGWRGTVAGMSADVGYTYSGPLTNVWIPGMKDSGLHTLTGGGGLEFGDRILQDMVWLPPGSNFRAMVYYARVPSGTLTLTGTLRLVRLRI